MYPRRTYVRRSSHGRTVLMAALLVVGLGLFVAFARPMVDNPKAPTEERTTTDVTLEAAEVYLVELFNSDDESRARVEAARYVPRGAAGYIMQRDGRYLVIGSGYETEYEAQEVSKNLTVGESIDAAFHVFSQDGVRLRITSTKSQLDAFTGADAAIRRASNALRQLSVDLDKGVKEPLEVRAELMTEHGAAKRALDALNAAKGDTKNTVVANWVDLLSLACEKLDGIANKEYDTKLYLSSALKNAFLSVRLGHINALKDLA